MTSSEFSMALKQARALMPKALRADRNQARSRIEYLLKPGDKTPGDRAVRLLADVTARLEKSAALKNTRLSSFPPVSVNPALPIADRQADIIAAVKANPVIIVSGATGSGKTTQIPKMCVAAGLGKDGRIGCTQPRRIAAMTIARRISDEIGANVGTAVGYKIRFSDRTADSTLIKIMTDGILLTEAHHDPMLNEYDVLVIDEAHERTLNIDFILGLLKTILRRRKDLKVVITSATIDTRKFSAAFDNAPVIEVSGTLFPVTVEYFQPEEKKASSSGDGETYVEQAVAAADQILARSPAGDILVFMPTAQDIRETCRIITGRKYAGVTVLPLYAQLPAGRQESVFKKQRGRKIIVATNIAETSLTVPGIRYVVDTGLARIPYYNPRTRVTSLAVRKISRSSALQRQGRCGRVAEGVCVRLYPEKDFSRRQVFTPPEILRANLAEVILRMMALRLGDVRRFPFVDPPMEKSIVDGYEVLFELGAISITDEHGYLPAHRFRLTGTGGVMARIPADPRLARILIEAGRTGCLEAALVIAAALSIADPREVPPESEKEARTPLAGFTDPASDFLTLLNLWEALAKKESGELKAFCRDCFLSMNRVREWRDIHSQLSEIVAESRLDRNPATRRVDPGIRPVDREKDPERFYEVFHRAILSGYLSNIAEKKEKNFYAAGKGREVTLFPGSALHNGEADWIVAAEMVETSRLYARTAARVEKKWIREVAGDLCRPLYINPRWSRERSEAVADRQLLLFGLCVGFETDVPYGPAHPREASDLFIRHALVRDEVDHPPAFMRHNRKVIEAVIGMEDRLRKKDFLVSETDLFAFFREKIDETVFSMEGLRKRIRKDGDKWLRLTPEDVMRREPDREEISLFPETIHAAGVRLPVSYRFDPADAADGVTVNIPARAASDVPPEPLDWLVPGLLAEKITALLKNLPKEHRRKLVPLNRTVAVIVEEMPRQERPLIMALSDFIFQRFGVEIPGRAWQPDKLPDYLTMRLAIVGEDGRTLSASRNSAILRRFDSSKAGPDDIAPIRRAWEKDGVDHRQFPDLPGEIPLPDGGLAVYPGLQVSGGAVGVRIFRNRGNALEAHCRGVRRLLEKRLSREANFVKQDVTLSPSMARQTLYLGGAEGLSAAMAEKILAQCLGVDIRGRAAFEEYAEKIPATLYQLAHELKQIVDEIVSEFYQARQELASLTAALNPRGEVARELSSLLKEMAALVPDNFIALYDRQRLAQLPRYIRSLRLKARRAVDNFPAHQQKSAQVAWAVAELSRLMADLTPDTSADKRRAVEDLFWMVEEYKLSVFTQEMKTAFPVSKKRIQERIREIDRMI